MSTSLRNAITQLASNFAAEVLKAIRAASLDELSAVGGRPSTRVGAKGAGAAGSARRGAGGRRRRRSADDIAKTAAQIVTLLKANPSGLRAEQIRSKLGLAAEDLPRPIAEALADRSISKTGQRRATTYYAGRGAKSAAKPGAAKASGKKHGRRPSKKK